MRLTAVVLSAVLAAAVPAGCPRQPPGRDDGKTVRILCGTFPIYLFTKAVTAGSDKVRVELMIPPALGCPHDYTLAPEDMKKIAAASVFVANGLGMEEFLGAPLKRVNPRIAVIDTSAGIGELIPLKEDPHEAGRHRHAGGNPHLFASPRMAARIVRNLADQLGRIDPFGAELYRRNARAYAAELETLADEFAAAVRDLPARKIVTEHEVFDYLARDCGLEVVAVVEATPGQEPSAAAMAELIKTIKASSAAAVFTEPQYPAKVSRVIAREAGVPVAVLDPVAGGPEGAGPDYYLTTMRANRDTLVKALGGRGK